MRIISTVKGVPVSSEEVYTGPARDTLEKVDRMFDFHFGFGCLKDPTTEVVALVKEAAELTAQTHHERHRQAEEAIAAFEKRFFLVRWFAQKPKPYADHSEEEALAAYQEKFERLLGWLQSKNRGSNFYLNQLRAEIAACEALLQELR